MSAAERGAHVFVYHCNFDRIYCPGVVCGPVHRGASELAKIFGISQLVIGLTVVAIGSSAPEIMVSINAALIGAMNLAVGNAVGSNITNVSLVLVSRHWLYRLPTTGRLFRAPY